MTFTAGILRVYVPGEDPFDKDGYPVMWQEVKGLVREQDGHRCLRCRHPYHVGHEGSGMWTTCDDECRHYDDAPVRVLYPDGHTLAGFYRSYNGGLEIARAGWKEIPGAVIQAKWRILTVHHLDGVKANLRWWNLVSLCQRCHLQVQAKVKLDRPWPWPHTDWFQIYAAGFYALKYLAEDITRADAERRLDDLLRLGLEEEAAERLPV